MVSQCEDHVRRIPGLSFLELLDGLDGCRQRAGRAALAPRREAQELAVEEEKAVNRGVWAGGAGHHRLAEFQVMAI